MQMLYCSHWTYVIHDSNLVRIILTAIVNAHMSYTVILCLRLVKGQITHE